MEVRDVAKELAEGQTKTSVAPTEYERKVAQMRGDFPNDI